MLSSSKTSRRRLLCSVLPWLQRADHVRDRSVMEASALHTQLSGPAAAILLSAQAVPKRSSDPDEGETATVATEIWAHQQGLQGKLGIRKLEIPGTEVLKARAAKDTKELIRKVLSGELTSGRALRGLWEFQGSES